MKTALFLFVFSGAFSTALGVLVGAIAKANGIGETGSMISVGLGTYVTHITLSIIITKAIES